MNDILKPHAKVKIYKNPQSEEGFEGTAILVHSCSVSSEKADAHSGLERWGIAFPKGVQVVNRWVSPRHLVRPA